MRVLALLLALAGSALAQYEITDFGGPWMPSTHAISIPPNGFTHSENMFAHPGSEQVPGYRIQRRGLTRALAASLGADPILATKAFWHEGDSLVILFFQGGNWYFTSYAEVSYGKANWYEGGATGNPSYLSGYTLNVPKMIRPYSDGTVDVIVDQDSMKADNENLSLFFRFAAPGDTVTLDTNNDGTYDKVFGTVNRIVHNSRLILDTLNGTETRTNADYRLWRPFSDVHIPDIEIYDRRAYVTNGEDPMQVIFWFDSTLWMREVHTAQRVPMNDVQMWFYDSLQNWISPARGYAPDPDELDTVVTRFMRIYSWGKAWAHNEWSGGLEVGPTDMYFFRFGSNSGPTTGLQNHVRITPIFYNNENSLVLLDPLLGWADTLLRGDTTGAGDSVFFHYYPFRNNTQTDTTSLHTSLTNNLVGHEGYVMSMAGNMEVVLGRDSSGTIKSLANASIWVSEDAEAVALLADGEVGLNEYIYFIHNLNPEETQTKTIATNETFRYQYFNGANLPQPFPEGWRIVYWYTYGGTQGDVNTEITPIPRHEWNKRPFGNSQDYIKVKIPNIDTSEIAISTREFYHVRFAMRDIGAGSDSIIFITSNQPINDDNNTRDVAAITHTDWELLRAEVPRFSGIEAHNRIGLVGWGDTTDLALVSRSTITVRGTEPENWSPAHDVKMTDEHDPVVVVESTNDYETIMTRRQIFGAQLTGSGLWTYEELSKNVGCVAPRSVVTINDVLYFRGFDGFYRIRRRNLTGFAVEPISDQIEAVLSRMDLSDNYGHDGTHLTENRGRVALELGLWDDRAKRIWWFLAMGASNFPNYALTYDPARNLWDGVHTIGAAAGTMVELRDTMHMLITDPEIGMPVWANYGVSDSGSEIVSVLESTVFGIAGDTVRVRPEGMALTYTTDAAATPNEDSIVWIMRNLGAQEFAANTSQTIKAPVGWTGLYTTTDRFLIGDVGSAVFWRWRLEHWSDLTNTLRRFQPLRMNVKFTPSGTGD